MDYEIKPPEELIETLNTVRADDLPDSQNWNQCLDILEQYECWRPLFKVVEKRMSIPSLRSSEDYIRLAKIQIKNLEDIHKATDYCTRLFSDLKVVYHDFRINMLPEMIDEEDYSSEGEILFSILKRLQTEEEKIECLERMCLIFEKKKYDEEKLNYSYEELLRTNPYNAKALRYFKAVYTQNQQWEKVIEVLRKLHSSAKHKNDGFRIAQEWATVLLFQLDNPQSCIKVLDEHCKDSPLDTSSLYYEAHYRKGDWHGCLKVLQIFFEKVDSDTNKAIVLLKIGELQELTEDIEQAIVSYQKSHELHPDYLESLENLIEINLQQRNWKEVVYWLEKMSSVVESNKLKERLDEAVVRIQDGLKSI